MPRAPKACGRNGCPTKVTGRTYCDDHTPIGWSSTDTGRNTPEHKAWRALVLAACAGRCQIRGPRCTHRAIEADHITPVGEGGARYDPANGQGACPPCHKAKTSTEAARGRARAQGATTPSP